MFLGTNTDACCGKMALKFFRNHLWQTFDKRIWQIIQRVNVSRTNTSPVWYVLIIQSNVELGPKMIQFNTQLKIHERKIHSTDEFIQHFVKNMQFNIKFKNVGKIIQNAQWYVSSAQITAPASPFYALFHIVCPFSYFHLFFILCGPFFQT